MNLGAIMAMLLSSGVCGPVDLPRSDGTMTRVIVCPQLAPIPADAPADKRKPADCGEVAFDSRDGERLTVGVCASIGTAPPADPEATEPDATPPLPGQKKT